MDLNTSKSADGFMAERGGCVSGRVELCSEVRLHVESIRSAAGYGTLEEGEEEKACWGTTPWESYRQQ